MYAAQQVQTTVTCPNCRWFATGQDPQTLKAAKEYHTTYRCPDDTPETFEEPRS
jgi:hypothetical protein